MEKLLPVKQKGKYGLRDIVDAILWQLRTGGQWRNLPDTFPKWGSMYYFFRKWAKDGTLKRLNAGPNMIERVRQGKEETPSMLSIDSQSVKSVFFTRESKGVHGNKKINGRKRHVITETLGLIWGVVVGVANEANGIVANKVVEPLLGYLHQMEKILADHAYSPKARQGLRKNNGKPGILGIMAELSGYSQ